MSLPSGVGLAAFHHPPGQRDTVHRAGLGAHGRVLRLSGGGPPVAAALKEEELSHRPFPEVV